MLLADLRQGLQERPQLTQLLLDPPAAASSAARSPPPALTAGCSFWHASAEQTPCCWPSCRRNSALHSRPFSAR